MCNFWYNNTCYTTKVTEDKNKIGQLIKSYYKDRAFKCDIQPIDEKAIKYTWGEDIKSNIQLFCDENFLIYDILVNDNKVYKIEKKIAWDNYYIYALLESDIKVYD